MDESSWRSESTRGESGGRAQGQGRGRRRGGGHRGRNRGGGGRTHVEESGARGGASGDHVAEDDMHRGGRGPGGRRRGRRQEPVFYESMDHIRGDTKIRADKDPVLVCDTKELIQKRGHSAVSVANGAYLDREHLDPKQYIVVFSFADRTHKFFKVDKGDPNDDADLPNPYEETDDRIRNRAFNDENPILSRSQRRQLREESKLVPLFQHFRDEIRLPGAPFLNMVPNGMCTIIGEETLIRHICEHIGRHEREDSLVGGLPVPIHLLENPDLDVVVEAINGEAATMCTIEEESVELGHTLKELHRQEEWKTSVRRMQPSMEDMWLVVLLERKRPGTLKVNIPGGRRMASESHFECAIRERGEEMGLPRDMEHNLTEQLISAPFEKVPSGQNFFFLYPLESLQET